MTKTYLGITFVALIVLLAWQTVDNPAKADGVPEDASRDNAPTIVSMIPANGSSDVDPNLPMIEVTFDRPMCDKSWSVVVLGSIDKHPQSNGPANYDVACRVFRLPVILEPNKEYVFGLNSERYQHFKSQEGTPLAPVEVRFKTREGLPRVTGEIRIKAAKRKIPPIKAYGCFYLLGFILHFVISWRMAKKLGLKRRIGITVSLCYLIGMTVGAKFLFHWKYIAFDPLVIFRREAYFQGGLWGGMLVYFALAFPVIVLLTRQKRAGLDLVALALPIPWAIGKIGCLCNGCCNGCPTSLPWAITFPEGSASSYIGTPVHPSQIYEMLIMVFLVVLFRKLINERWRGTLLFWFISIYGVGRAATDVFRGDASRYTYLGPVTLTQLICLVSTMVSLVVLLAIKHMNSPTSKLLTD